MASAVAHSKDQKSLSNDDKVPAAPLVLVSNSWLEDLTSRTRAKPIPWEGYHRADLVSAEELKMIKKVDRQPKSKVDQTIDQEGSSYATLYLRLLSKLSRTDTLQQILVLVGDMLEGRDDRVQLFKNDNTSNQPSELQDSNEAWPYAPFIKLLETSDPFVQLKSAQFLTLLLVSPTSNSKSSSSVISSPPSVLSKLLAFLTSSISLTAASDPSPSGYAEGNGPDIGIQLLEALLRTQEYREEVWKDDLKKMATIPSKAATGEEHEIVTSESSHGLIGGLIQILRAGIQNPNASATSAFASKNNSGANTPRNGTTGNSSSSSSSSGNNASSSLALPTAPSGARTPGAQGLAGPQMQYQCIFCLWLLTFNEEIAGELNTKFGIIPLLSDIARSAVKEKVVRVVAATFRNSLVKAPDANAPPMLGAKVLPLVESLSARKWSDEEIEEDLQLVKEVLSERLKGMSTYDEYLSELKGGQLTWSNPAHELDDFWKENAARLSTDEGGEQLKLLVQILADENSSPQTLAIACHDIGKLVQFNEPSKKRIDELGAKVRIMALMSHSDGEVKYRALGTVSRLVSGSWRKS